MIEKLDNLNKGVMSIERSIVNLIASIIPWLAPVAPAIMTYKNLTDRIGFGNFSAVIVALVVEFLGLSTGSTAIMLWRHNSRYSNEKYHLPTWMPLASFIFYLLLVMSLNVFVEYMSVDYPEYTAYTEIFSKALLVLLSVPAFAVLVTRSLYSRTVEAIEQRYARRKKSRAKKEKQEAKEEKHSCEYCGADFATVQAVSAHMRFCEKYKNEVVSMQKDHSPPSKNSNGHSNGVGEGREATKTTLP